MKITIKFFGGTEKQIKNITTLLYNKLIKIIDINDVLLKKEKCIKIFSSKNTEDKILKIGLYNINGEIVENSDDYFMILNSDIHSDETIVLNILIKMANSSLINKFNI